MQITDKDIKELDELQLTRLAHWLVVNEARSYEIAASNIQCTFDIDTGDGGEDLSIQWDGGPDKTDNMWRDTIFQIKATPMGAANCRKELLTKSGELKPKLKALFARGGTYILFCNRTSKDQVKAMTEVVESHGFANPSIRSYNPAAIEIWVNKYFPVMAFVAEQRGKNLPINLQTWHTWSRYPAHREQFIADDVLDAYANVLRDKAQSKGNVVRVCGPSGLGKSRLAIEAFSEPCLQRSVVFVDASTGSHMQDHLVSWLQKSFEGALVVDNCTA